MAALGSFAVPAMPSQGPQNQNDPSQVIGLLLGIGLGALKHHTEAQASKGGTRLGDETEKKLFEDASPKARMALLASMGRGTLKPATQGKPAIAPQVIPGTGPQAGDMGANMYGERQMTEGTPAVPGTPQMLNLNGVDLGEEDLGNIKLAQSQEKIKATEAGIGLKQTEEKRKQDWDAWRKQNANKLAQVKALGARDKQHHDFVAAMARAEKGMLAGNESDTAELAKLKQSPIYTEITGVVGKDVTKKGFWGNLYTEPEFQVQAYKQEHEADGGKPYGQKKKAPADILTDYQALKSSNNPQHQAAAKAIEDQYDITQ